MSRSYKHTPYCGLKKNKFFKNYANRRLRRKKLEHDLQHKSYQKDFCSWEICDYYEIETKNFEEYYKSCLQRWQERQSEWYWQDEPLPTKEECWKEYQKWYIRK
jgi:hypothetical protein